MKLSVESKVGIFFLLGLTVLAVVTFKVEDLGSLLKRKNVMRLYLKHATGLEPGSTVAVAGVKVGEVKEVRLRPDDIEILMSIDADVTIKESASATVAWGGLLGNRYIDISMGSPADPDLKPGSAIKAEKPLELNELFAKADTALTKVGDMLEASEFGPKLTQVMDTVLSISDDIKEQRGLVGKLLGPDSAELYEEAQTIAADLKDTSARLKKLFGENEERINAIIEGLQAAAPEAKEAVASIKRVGELVESGEGLLPALLKDKKMRDDLKNAVARLETSLDKLEQFTTSLKEGEGLAGRIVNDKELAADVAEAVKSIKAITERLEKGDNTLARLTRDKDLYDDVKKLVNDARETLRNVKDQVPVGTFAGLLLSAF